MQCPSCANDIPEQSNFCGFCGHRVQRPAAPAPAAAAPAPAAAAPAPAPVASPPADAPSFADEVMRTAMGATLIGAPAFPTDDDAPPADDGSGDDINATQAMTALGGFEAEARDTAAIATVEAEAPNTAPEPAVTAAAAPARATGPEPIAYRAVPAATPKPVPRAEEPSVIVDTAVQREAAALEEATVTARDLGEGAKAAVAEAPRAEPAAPAVAAPEPAPVAKAEPAPVAKAEPAPVAKAEPAPVAKAEPAPKAAPAKKPESAKKPDAKRAEASKKPAAAPPPAAGDFRETAWFMQAIDPEKLGDIERDDPSARQDRYKDGQEIVDTQQRRQFSLNVDAAQPVRETNVRQARLDLEKADAGGGNKALVLGIVVAVLGGLGAAAWFLFAGR
jgi:hypothetical protein